MAALDRQHQTYGTGSDRVRRNGISETHWQTPVLSSKFKSRVVYEPGVAGSGNPPHGASETDHTVFCTANGTAFQPIRTYVTIPTAHVMPSTQGNHVTPLVNQHATSGRSPGPVGTSTALLEPSQSRVPSGASPTSAPFSDKLSLEALAALKMVDYGFENSLSPWGDIGRDEVRKFDIPNVEPTLNQSTFLDTLSSDAHLRTQMYNRGTLPAEIGKELYGTLPSSKSPSRSCLDGSSQPTPMSHQQNQAYSKPLTPITQVWRQQPYTQQLDGAAWHHQREKMQMQMEQLQGMSSATFPQASVYGIPPQSAEPSLWKNIVKSTETLLKDKDLLVERQRQHIAQLEQKMLESELQVHSALLSRPAPYGDIYVLRLQEMQRENTFLRAQFAEQYESFKKEKVELEQKLAAVEANNKSFNDNLQAATQKHEQELKKQEERVKGRDKHINNLKKKCQKENEQNREKQQRIETLERYLADLPTQEDHQKQTQKLKETSEKCSELLEKVAGLERTLTDARSACRERDAQIENEKQRVLELVTTVKSLQEKLDGCLEKGEGAQQPTLVNEELKQECQALKREQEYLNKMVNSQKRKIDQLNFQLKTLKEQAAQEESSEQALIEESRRRDETVQQLKEAVKELSSQNQDLIEKNLTLQEQLEQQNHDSVPPDDTTNLLKKLYRDMFLCLQDLQSVCSTIFQRSQGSDPNLSLLLGIHSLPPDMDESVNMQNPEVLTRKLAEVKQLHKDIVELRTSISDHYASDMGENCVTQ
ncbi:centrosomal protein of 85 kDa [Lissotriton helveticus]